MMGLRKFKRYMRNQIKSSAVLREQKLEESLVMANVKNVSLPDLTMAEKEQVKAMWGEILPDFLRSKFRWSFEELRIFKYIKGFDPRYVSHYMYLPLIARALNDYHYTKIFEDKCLLGGDVSSKISCPQAYVRKIDGEYYGGDMRQISVDDVVNILTDQNELILKDAKDSSGGVGVEKICRYDKSMSRWTEEIRALLVRHQRDFVVQECIHQHPCMAAFNKTSVNTFRITTLYLNGRFSVLSIILRMGQSGASVDNWGAGGILIDVQSDGQLAPLGYDIKLNSYDKAGEVVFKDTCIESLPIILQQVQEAHETQFSLCKLIGWDIAIDEQGEAVLIEVNSSQPGLIGEQLNSGPIFGERTQEVIDYCKSKMQNWEYQRALFRY